VRVVKHREYCSVARRIRASQGKLWT
jgi:hypothetical protein